MLDAAVDERNALVVQHAEVTYERVQPTPVARRGDDDVGLDTPPVGEYDVGPVEADHGGHDLDATCFHVGDETVVIGRCRSPFPQRGGDSVGCAAQAVPVEPAGDDALADPSRL